MEKLDDMERDCTGREDLEKLLVDIVMSYTFGCIYLYPCGCIKKATSVQNPKVQSQRLNSKDQISAREHTLRNV